MKKDIRERLRAEVLLADGAMGTLLVSRGAPAEGPRSPNALTAPELVREIHDDYVAAGAQLLSTNTWDANRSKLSRFDWADSLEKINREAVRLARAAAAGEYVYVAGAVGPLGQLVKPYGPLTRLHVRELFTEQIRILLEEGVDLLSFETFSSTLEAAEALRAARALSAEIPIVASMTFLADGKTSFGEDVEDALSTLVAAGADVVGINCTVGPQEAFEIFGRAAGSVSVPISVRPNAGYPWVVSGRTVYPATPDYFRQSARDLLHAGAALVGGCCGTAPEHVAAMAREALGKARSTPAPPTRAVFVEDRSARPRRDRRSRAPEGRRRLGRGGRRPYPARPRRGRDQHHRQPDGAPPDVVHRRRASHPHGNGCRDDLPLLAARPERPRHPVGPPRRGRARHQGASRRGRRSPEDRGLPAGEARRRGGHSRAPPDRARPERGHRPRGRRDRLGHVVRDRVRGEPRGEGPRRRDLEALRQDRGGRDVRPDPARLRRGGAGPFLRARRGAGDSDPDRPHPAEEPEAGPLLRE